MLKDVQIDVHLAHHVKTKVVVARTPAKVIWHMLTYETEYHTQNNELMQRKYKMMECLVDTSVRVYPSGDRTGRDLYDRAYRAVFLETG